MAALTHNTQKSYDITSYLFLWIQCLVCFSLLLCSWDSQNHTTLPTRFKHMRKHLYVLTMADVMWLSWWKLKNATSPPLPYIRIKHFEHRKSLEGSLCFLLCELLAPMSTIGPVHSRFPLHQSSGTTRSNVLSLSPTSTGPWSLTGNFGRSWAQSTNSSHSCISVNRSWSSSASVTSFPRWGRYFLSMRLRCSTLTVCVL